MKIKKNFRNCNNGDAGDDNFAPAAFAATDETDVVTDWRPRNRRTSLRRSRRDSYATQKPDGNPTRTQKPTQTPTQEPTQEPTQTPYASTIRRLRK